MFIIYTYKDLQIMQSWSLERKVRVTQLRIMEWYKHFILDILCQTCFDIKYQVNKTVFAKTVLTLYANFILRIAQRGMGKMQFAP